MVHHCYNIKEFLKKSLIFVLAFVLSFEIEAIKSAIKNIIIFAEKNNILLGVKFLEISELCFFIRKCALIYLFLCIISFPLINFYLLIRNYFNRPKIAKLSPFENSMYNYINDRSYGKGYLVTGEWGSGKTYIVTEFFNKYYKFSNKPIYRISCFGLDSRKLLLDEIKNQIEINDKSSLNWIQYIPIIGNPLFSMLKDSYSLNSIPKGSIFIFDDFERITSLGITNNQEFESYKKDSFILRSGPREHTYQEFRDINEEFTKIQEAFSKFDRDNEIASITTSLEKYNIATGLVNELIENYNIKVIIICNVDILGYDYLDKVFRGKLDCITYNKSIDEKSIEGIFKSTFQNQVYLNKDLEKLVTNFTNTITNDFNKVWVTSGNSNLRQAKSIIQAFLDTINIISSKITLSEGYLASLFYSIYVVRVLRDTNNLGNLSHFLVGGNLAFFLDLYGKGDLRQSMESSDYFSSLKWTGISIAGFWTLNMEKPDNIEELVNYYTDYEYNDLEITLLNNDNYRWNGEKILVEHAMYLARVESLTSPLNRNNELDDISKIVRSNIGYILEHSQDEENLMEENVRNLLLKIGTMLGGAYYSRFLEKWYESIYEYSKVTSVIEEKGIDIFREYNKFIQKRNNAEELS